MSEELRHLLSTLTAGDGALGQLTEACADIVAVSGSGIMLMTQDVQRGFLRTSDAVSATLEELQYEFAEGPCLDAYAVQRPVFEPDLASPAEARWPSFTPPAVAAGVAAVFGFPMSVGETQLGSLNLYRTTAGPMTDLQVSDARELAELMAIAVLGVQGGASSGEIASELSDGEGLQDRVHQATGMLAVQLEVSVGEALRVLHDHARTNGVRLQEVAEDVVERRMRFDTPEGEAT